MREFINEFGKENFTIIAIVVLVILIALVLIVVIEKTKLKKTIKQRAKMVLANTKLLKEESEKNEEKQKEENISKAKKLLSSKSFEALKNIERMEDTIKYSEKIKRQRELERKELEKRKELELKKRKQYELERKKQVELERRKALKHKPIQRPVIKNEEVKEKPELIKKDILNDKYDNLTYTNEKADVVYKNNTMTPEEAKEKLEEVTKKLIEDKKEVNLTVFEEEQEEKSIISYDELIKASQDIDEKNDRLLEDEQTAAITLDELYKPKKVEQKIKVPEVKEHKEIKRSYSSEYVSPVFVRDEKIHQKKKEINRYSNFKDEDSEVFLEKLKKLRSKLD